MQKGLMFYDDEYADSGQHICSLAYILCDNDGNQLGDPVNQLINPEHHIEWRTRKVHGLTDEDVAGQPTFAQFCVDTNFLDLLSSYTFVAHNASGADLYHIKKSLAAYGIEMPEVYYIDTMSMSMANLRLGSIAKVCAYYNIPLNHHDALSDALACKSAYEKMNEEFPGTEPLKWAGKKSKPSKGSRASSYSIGMGLGTVNGSDRTIEDVLAEFEANGLRENPSNIETLEGLHIVVTGAVPGYPGDSIEETLEGLGAKTSKNVSGKTQLVVLGNNAGQRKIDPALERGTHVISVIDLLEILSRVE